jgi:hypothetical protein
MDGITSVSFMKIHQAVQKLLVGDTQTDTDTYTDWWYKISITYIEQH